MLEEKVKLLSESLARGMDRRGFLRNAGHTVFAGMVALAAGHAVGGRAFAKDAAEAAIPDRPRCIPPGPYCNIDGISEPTGCNGAHCYRHLHQGQMLMCKVYYIYQSGCWTTADGNGYWTCCDCRCSIPGGSSVTCGCASYSRSPIPSPTGPASGGGKK